MTNRTAKRILVLALAALMAVLWCGAAFAGHTVDHDRTGSISITLRDAKTLKPVTDATFALYCVGLLNNTGYELCYDKTLGFAEFSGDINDWNDTALIPALEKFIRDAEVDALALVSADGTGLARFEDLPLGLYLVTQPSGTRTHYGTESFLVMVPMTDPALDEWVYDIDASPKVSVKPTPTPKPTTPPTKLPQTGMLLWPVPVLFVSGLVLFIAGWILSRKSRHET